jgi:hypothetical protein
MEHLGKLERGTQRSVPELLHFQWLLLQNVRVFVAHTVL